MNESERKHLEHELNANLGRACESARREIPGFQWVTHVMEYNEVATNIHVVWVFDSNRHLAEALRAGQEAYLNHLTETALEASGVAVGDIRQHVDFDSEEECARAHGGDWKLRLTAEPDTIH